MSQLWIYIQATVQVLGTLVESFLQFSNWMHIRLPESELLHFLLFCAMISGKIGLVFFANVCALTVCGLFILCWSSEQSDSVQAKLARNHGLRNIWSILLSSNFYRVAEIRSLGFPKSYYLFDRVTFPALLNESRRSCAEALSIRWHVTRARFFFQVSS